MENSVVMVKGLLPEVAKEVGKSAAILLQQLLQWFKSKTVDRVYRTNEEMFEDLHGVLSPATIQRCKQRLIEKGYVIVSFDKGLNRVTHYKLTEKGQVLLDASKAQRKTAAQPETKADTAKPVAKYSRKPAACKSNNALEHNPVMKKSFDEGFENKDAVPMPANLLALFGKKNAEVVEVAQPEQTAEELEWAAIVQAEMEMQEEEFSDEDYANAEIAMLQSIEAAAQPAPEQSMTFADLMQTAYSKATTKAQELVYTMQQDQQYFKEDF